MTTDPGKGPKGITTMLVGKDTPGITIGAGDEKLGMRGSDWGEITFTNVEVPAEQLLGAENRGWEMIIGNCFLSPHLR